ncbi:MAG: phage antirepressor Ant [Thalassobius sp.]|nr:phage antirepressor Ant [Thalassovita sp.]
MELIKIYKGNLISARDLYEFLEVKSRFNDWINNRIKRYKFEEDVAFTKVLVKGTGGRGATDYLMTLHMAKELCMVENNELGAKARQYFIQCEETLRALKENKRVEAFSKLEATKQRLLANIKSINGTYEDYIQIDYEGRKVLFNGQTMEDVELPLLLLKGRDFATELTNESFKLGITDLDTVENWNKENHNKVRSMISENTGKFPEQLNPEKRIENKNTEDEE